MCDWLSSIGAESGKWLGEKKSKEEYFVTCEHDMKFKFQYL